MSRVRIISCVGAQGPQDAPQDAGEAPVRLLAALTAQQRPRATPGGPQVTQDAQQTCRPGGSQSARPRVDVDLEAVEQVTHHRRRRLEAGPLVAGELAEPPSSRANRFNFPVSSPPLRLTGAGPLQPTDTHRAACRQLLGVSARQATDKGQAVSSRKAASVVVSAPTRANMYQPREPDGRLFPVWNRCGMNSIVVPIRSAIT